ncbi:cupin domain-containing protein [Methylocystis suflitae]|uniref:cupin domain-containing protein n=1 Tax=Methylocystis suflitae TaxID=2951405 RepID=UPI00210B74B8|nr:cupin domain-containing protein [Methylocystis suflitae]MCQ4188957.1 cupin domain-containing protein [Methylocystis suflitae]
MEQQMIRMGFIAILSVAFSTVGAAAAKEPAPAEVVTEIARATKTATGQPITLPQGPLEVVASIYTLAPGVRLPEHKHPYQRYAYILEGQLMVQQADSASRVYHAGEFVIESVDRWHFGATVGAVPVKLLVIDQLPPGSDVTVNRPPTP